MRRATYLRLALATIAFASVSGAGARDAEASGYLTARFGSDYGTPATPNTFAVYYNPAALGGAKGTTITGDLSLALRWAHYQRGAEALSPSGNARERELADQRYIDANTGNANLLDLVTLPYVGVNTDFGGSKYLRGGYAAYIPFGGSASWQKRPEIAGVPGAQDGVQRWHNISGSILSIYNTFAIAVVIPDTGLSIGANVSPVIHRVSTVRARTADDSDDIEFANGTLKEGRSLLQASGLNIAATAGVYWESPDDARIKLGLSYLSQPGFGTTRMSGTLDGRTAGGDVKQDIDFLQAYPDIIRIGAKYRLPGDKVELRTDGNFVRWSVFENQCVVLRGKNCNVDSETGAEVGGTNDVVLNIPRNWKNSIGWRFGAGVFLTKELEVFGSASFSTSAVPKSTIDASTIDSTRLYGTLGARYELNRHWAFAGSYNHIYFFKVNTNGENRFNELAKPSQSPSADGKYYSQIGMLNLNVAYTF
jgi:long-subunit fatty acid transport protein